ncbi:MAG: sugar phosphate isomerase/epimerase family protein [Puniceicoccaceae bacterium]
MTKTLTLLLSTILLNIGTVSLLAKAPSPTGLSGPTIAWWCYASEGGVGPFDTKTMIGLAKKYDAHLELPPFNLISTIQDAGIEVSCLVPEVPDLPPFILSVGNPQERDTMVKSLKQAIDVASDHGVPMVICFTGNKDLNQTIQQQFDKMVAEYKKLAAYAKKKDVILVLEPLNNNRFLGAMGGMKGHPGYLGHDPWFCLDLIKAVGSDSLGLAVDWYHLGVEDYDFGLGGSQDLGVFIEAARPHIFHTHVAGIYDNKVLMRGPLHVAGQKLDYKRVYDELNVDITYLLENPIYGGAEDATAAEEAIAGAIQIIQD